MIGEPAATRDPILEIVDAEHPPLRFFLGRGQVERVAEEYDRRMATWREWNEWSERAHGTLH